MPAKKPAASKKKPAPKATVSTRKVAKGAPVPPAKKKPAGAKAPATPVKGKTAASVEAKPAVKPVAAPAPQIVITQDAIAKAAYFRWMRCGGDEHTNWVEAERELRAEYERTR